MDIVDHRYDASSDVEWLKTISPSTLDQIAKDGKSFLYGAVTYFSPGSQTVYVVDDLCEAPTTVGNIVKVKDSGLHYVCRKGNPPTWDLMYQST
jgi:hypothetical protein